MQAGSVIAGKYRLTEPLGRGGMGAVWRAEHVLLGTPLAVKLMDPGISATPEAIARFSREARAAAALRSPNVVHVFDFGVDSGTPYIAMELLEGESLAQLLERTRGLAADEVTMIFAQLGRAVGKAHELRIVHRDLKPDNVFLVRHDQSVVVKVLDFGIAKLTGEAGLSVSSNTRTGTMLGTPLYMSPEQARGNRLVDHRTDLWALGVIAFECVCGQKPFSADTLGELIIQICTEPLPIPSQVAPVPAGFDAWFRRAADRDPDRRFQSAAELTEALLLALGSGAPSSQVPSRLLAPVPAVSIGSTEVQKTGAASTLTLAGARRSRWPRVAGIALFVLIGLVGGIGLMSLKAPGSPELLKLAAELPHVPRAVEPSSSPVIDHKPEVAPAVASAVSSAAPGVEKTPPPRPLRRHPPQTSSAAPSTHKKWGI